MVTDLWGALFFFVIMGDMWSELQWRANERGSQFWVLHFGLCHSRAVVRKRRLLRFSFVLEWKRYAVFHNAVINFPRMPRVVGGHF
ncbi:hypothetical protein HOY80DRAFT_963882 [Tuber brumale]|nr:hypothetical protein HOY80DRAFT_963882 [Tuber brumale]